MHRLEAPATLTEEQRTGVQFPALTWQLSLPSSGLGGHQAHMQCTYIRSGETLILHPTWFSPENMAGDGKRMKGQTHRNREKLESGGLCEI